MTGTLPRLLARAVIAVADRLLAPRRALAAALPAPDGLLWRADARDVTGPVSVMLCTLPAQRLGVMVTTGGHLTGLRLDRGEAQALRHAVTGWLVDAAPAVTR